MKTSEVFLQGFSDIAILYKYLYMNNNSNKIIVHNQEDDKDLALVMSKELVLLIVNDSENTMYPVSDLSLLLDIIEELKKDKPGELYESFCDSKWSEIKEVVDMTTKLLEMKYKENENESNI